MRMYICIWEYHTAHKLDFEISNISKCNILLTSIAMCYLQCKTAEDFGIMCNSCCQWIFSLVLQRHSVKHNFFYSSYIKSLKGGGVSLSHQVRLVSFSCLVSALSLFSLPVFAVLPCILSFYCRQITETSGSARCFGCLVNHS